MVPGVARSLRKVGGEPRCAPPGIQRSLLFVFFARRVRRRGVWHRNEGRRRGRRRQSGRRSVGDDEIGAGPGRRGPPVNSSVRSRDPIGTGFPCGVAGRWSAPWDTVSDCNGDHADARMLCDGRSWTCDRCLTGPSNARRPAGVSRPVDRLTPVDACGGPWASSAFDEHSLYACGGGSLPPPTWRHAPAADAADGSARGHDRLVRPAPPSCPGSVRRLCGG